MDQSTSYLNGGLFSYHRIGVVQWSPWRFVEWGWRKTPSGYEGLIAYINASGNAENVAISGISATKHTYSMQYDPNTLKYWFYVDGVNVFNVNANFSSGNAVIAGGETLGVEAMANTKLFNLHYLKKNPDGTFVYVSWGGHVNYADDPPYYNINISLNAFSDNP